MTLKPRDLQRKKRVVIDYLAENVPRYRGDYAIVAVDVIRATTTAVTAVARGRRCFPVTSVQDAMALAKRLQNPLLVGELGGNTPYGFDVTNSPAELDARTDVERPMILLSSSGTQLMCASEGAGGAYAACFRNYCALAQYLSLHRQKVAVIGAGTRGEFREEDQMCCVKVAEILVQLGYTPADALTIELLDRWRYSAPEDCLVSKSVEYLRNTNQERDLDFILSHINDVGDIFKIGGGELARIPFSEEKEPVVTRQAEVPRSGRQDRS